MRNILAVVPVLALLLLASIASRAAELSAVEQRWLKGAWPVIEYAKTVRLPLDIVVQPQPTPDAAPLAMAFVKGRCKLVLSMRENPEAEATLARIEPDLVDPVLELMAAHELGHCRRYLDGAWYSVPAGFQQGAPKDADVAGRADLDPEVIQAFTSMRAARREEGYGDLVGLAWVQEHRPQLFARLHAWLSAERLRDRIPGSHHDTLAWLRLVRHGFQGTAPTIFAASTRIWADGLSADD